MATRGNIRAPVMLADEIVTRSLMSQRRREEQSRSAAQEIAYPDDPVYFIEEVLGDQLWSKQKEIARAAVRQRAVYTRKCHASGGTWLMARLALWFLYAWPRDSTAILTTAPTGRQVSELLWREVRTAYHNSRRPLPGRLYEGANKLNVSGSQYMLGFSAKRPSDVPGFHAKRVLVIKDEAAGIDEPIQDALESALSGGATTLKLEMSQPLKASGRFYNAFNKDKALNAGGLFKIEATDTPGFTGEPHPHAESLLSPEWVAEKRQTWGTDSTLYRVRILANFPALGTKQLISPEWCERAALKDPHAIEDGPLVLGVDVGGMGRAETVLTPRAGNWLFDQTVLQGQDPVEVAGHVMLFALQHHPKCIAVDVTGIGAGTMGRLKELKKGGALTDCTLVAVIAGGRPRKMGDYENRGSELWATFANRLREGEMGGRFIEELNGQLIQAQAWPASNGKLHVDKYGEVDASPDRADSAVYTEAAIEGLRFRHATVGTGERT